MHSTACGVASRGSITTLPPNVTPNGLKMVHNNDDAMNKIPLKSATGLDDEEKNGGECLHDSDAAADEARLEQRRAKLLAWMKKLTIVLICFIGIALISYVIISLCFSDWPKSTPATNKKQDTTSNSTVTTTATATATNAATALAAVSAIENKNQPIPQQTQSPQTPSLSPTTLLQSTTNTNYNNLLLSDDNNSNNNPHSFNSTSSIDSNSSSSGYSKIISAASASAAAAAATNINDNNNGKSNGNDDGHRGDDNDNLPPAVAASTSADVTKQTVSTTAATAPTTTSSTTTTTTTQADATTQTTEKTELNENILQDMPSTSDTFESTLGVYEHAAVCSDKQVCSQIGSNILESNGSAVDATIATLLCNGLLTMQSMGIGGGLLMNVYVRKTKHAYSIDAREVSPYSAEPDMFDADPKSSLHGPHAIAVPGEVMGYHRAHEKFGKLPWRELVEPSLKLCADGYYISHHQYMALTLKWPYIKDNEQLKEVFMNPETGELHVVGTKVKPPKKLCDTYQMLADNGPLDFYNGTLAKLIIEDLKELGSNITAYDLEVYFADLVSSITMQLGDDTLYAMPPVSSGTVVAHILSILEGYNFTRDDLMGSPEQQALTIHRFTEAFKLAFAKRWELGDLRFNDVRELMSKLTSPPFGDEQRTKINDSQVHEEISDYGAQFVGNEDTGTSHIVVLAPNGDAVSVTSTVNYYFGSGMVGPRTGIIFNSGMDDFSVPQNAFNLPPSPSNIVEGRKRAMSSQSPMLLANRKGDIRLAIGSAGGPKIIPGIVEVAARVLWFGQNIKEAIDAPRFYHQLLPNVLQFENGRFDKDVLQLLRDKGHVVQSFNDIGSVVCGIVRNETAIYANADYRKRGGTAGF